MKAKPVSPSREKTAAGAKKAAVSPAKKKVVATAKKKAASPAKKKPVLASKGKVAHTAKKKTASSSRAKPVSIAKKKLELNDQVAATFKGKRLAYFVLENERKDGAYIVCVAIENEPGFYLMDWGWHCSFTKAKSETALMNIKIGLTEEEVNEIIISTMGPTY